MGHISPEAAAGGATARVCDGNVIEIDSPARRTQLALGDDELAQRRAAVTRYKPATPRPRKGSPH